MDGLKWLRHIGGACLYIFHIVKKLIWCNPWKNADFVSIAAHKQFFLHPKL